jgi:hypothetical protein
MAYCGATDGHSPVDARLQPGKATCSNPTPLVLPYAFRIVRVHPKHQSLTVHPSQPAAGEVLPGFRIV